jgi:signal peptidase II
MAAPPVSRPGWIAAGAAGGFLADQLSKLVVLRSLAGGESVPVLAVLNLTLVHNRGVGFGLLAGDGPAAPWLLAGMAAVIIALLLAWLGRSASRVHGMGLGLVIGGAVGNVADRVRGGAVVDFLHVHAGALGVGFGNVFNVADIEITLGVMLILGHALWLRRRAAAASIRGEEDRHDR